MTSTSTRTWAIKSVPPPAAQLLAERPLAAGGKNMPVSIPTLSIPLLHLLSLCVRVHAGSPLALVDCARNEAEYFASVLQLRRPLVIRVIEKVPTRNATAGQWAWARRDRSGFGCALDFLPDAAQDAETIAHEVCHCKFDFQIMSVSGEVAISDKERERVEARASRCAEWLTDEGLESQLQRRQAQQEGKLPSFVEASRTQGPSPQYLPAAEGKRPPRR